MSDGSLRRVRFDVDQGSPLDTLQTQISGHPVEGTAVNDHPSIAGPSDRPQLRRASASWVARPKYSDGGPYQGTSKDDLGVLATMPPAHIDVRSLNAESDIYPRRASDDQVLHGRVDHKGADRRVSLGDSFAPSRWNNPQPPHASPYITPYVGPKDFCQSPLLPTSPPSTHGSWSVHTPEGSPEATRHLRPALRQPVNQPNSTLAPEASNINLARRSSSRLEEGGVRAQDSVLGGILKLYGLTRRSSSMHPQMGTSLSRRTNSGDSRAFTSARAFDNRRNISEQHTPGDGEDELLDPDDPRITGASPNRIDQEKHAHDTFVQDTKGDKRKKRRAAITYHIASVIDRQNFMLKFARALILFGAPSHRIEAQLNATARVLELEAQFVHLPSIVIASFGDYDTRTSRTNFIKVNGRLELGRLHQVHNIYRQVVHDEIGVEEATAKLGELVKARPIYNLITRCIISALCTGMIAPLAFGGSFLDMLVAAGEGALLCFLQLGVASKNAMYSNVFEISVAVLMSFIARALSSIPSQIFCYSAISSSGVVLVLPGYMILCSALELASKNIVSGSVKLTFAVVYSLFLGFGLTIGSDLYLLLDPRARNSQAALAAGVDKIVIHGSFMSNDTVAGPSNFAGSFSFSNSTGRDMTHWIEGCYRDPSWPWYLQPFPLWSLFLLVPAFSIFSSLGNLQPFRSKQLAVMVIISCCSFAANKAANSYIFNRSDVVSAIGAFVIGVLGNLYSRLTNTGTSFTSMVTGVLFLVPAGIAETGGLSMNYQGQDGDEYSNGLSIGLRMIQVAIGITVGLFGSALVVYSFGRQKRSAMFAF